MCNEFASKRSSAVPFDMGLEKAYYKPAKIVEDNCEERGRCPEEHC